MRFVLKEVSRVRGQQTSEGRKELAIVNKAMEFLMVDKSSKWYFTVLFQLEMSFSGKNTGNPHNPCKNASNPCLTL